MKRKLPIFISAFLMVSWAAGGLQGCAMGLKSDGPIVMAKATYYDANLWYNDTLQIYLKHRSGMKPEHVKELNGLFLECNEILTTWSLAIELKDLSRMNPQKFRETKNLITNKTIGYFKGKESRR